MSCCYANPEALIEPTRLVNQLDDAAVRVIEVDDYAGCIAAVTSPAQWPGAGTPI